MNVQDLSKVEWEQIMTGVHLRDRGRLPFVNERNELIPTTPTPEYWTDEDAMRRFSVEHNAPMLPDVSECSHARRVWRPLEQWNGPPDADGAWDMKWFFEGICPDCWRIADISVNMTCVPAQ